MAAHASARTTKLYDWPGEAISLDETYEGFCCGKRQGWLVTDV